MIIKSHHPPLHEKFFFLLAGFLISTPFPILASTLISYFLYINYSRFVATLIVLAFVAPLLEEFAKTYHLFYRHGETQKSLILLGFYTGLGFGIAEFLLYVFLFKVPIIVRLPPLFFHATNTTITAFGIGHNRSFEYYLLAVFLHGIYNASAQFGFPWFIIGIIAALFSYLLAWKFYDKSAETIIGY